MIDYSTLSSEVLGNLGLDSSMETAYKISQALNAAQIHLLNILPHQYLSEAVATRKGNLVTGIPAYQYPTDFMRFIRLWVNYENPISDERNGYEAKLWADGDIQSIATIDLMPDIHHPTVELGVEGGFEIRPIPTADVLMGWRLRFIQRLPDMSSVQPCLLRGNLRNLLVYYASAYCARVNNFDQALATTFQNMFAEELKDFLPKKEQL